jgi:hypothetical protein
MILNTDQCNSEDLTGTSLSGKCGIYGGVCKQLCSNIVSSNDACNTRGDDCFWLWENPSGSQGECVEKVWCIIFYVL